MVRYGDYLYTFFDLVPYYFHRFDGSSSIVVRAYLLVLLRHVRTYVNTKPRRYNRRSTGKPRKEINREPTRVNSLHTAVKYNAIHN